MYKKIFKKIDGAVLKNVILGKSAWFIKVNIFELVYYYFYCETVKNQLPEV